MTERQQGIGRRQERSYDHTVKGSFSRGFKVFSKGLKNKYCRLQKVLSWEFVRTPVKVFPVCQLDVTLIKQTTSQLPSVS